MMDSTNQPNFNMDDDDLVEDSRPATLDATASRGEIKKLLKRSGEFFIEFFLAEELTMPVPQFHKDVWELFTSTALPRILLAIPRDHAKTTLAKLGVIWYWLFTDHRFAVYLSNTNGRAKDACRDIINFLKCDNFRQVFGDVKITKESETESIWIFEMPAADGRVKKCILRAVGSNQSMRGINVDNQRPDIAVVDDVEDEDNTANPNLQAKLDRWVFGTFIKALSRKPKIIWLGNMLAKTSLLSRLSKNPRWNPVVFGALIRNNETGELQPLWADRWPLEELEEDFQEYRGLGLVETWMCEMMNMPGHGVNGFTQDQIYYRPIPGPDEIQAAWICIDPAFGEGAIHDSTSITVHVLPNEGPPMVVNEVTGKMREHEMFETTFRLAMYWNAWVWGIEAVAAQRVLLTLFKHLLVTKGMGNQVELVPLIAGRGDSKISRISSWVSLMEKEEYAIFEGAVNITTQLLSYNMTKNNPEDDLIDSCAYGPQMVERYLGMMIAQFAGKKAGFNSAAKLGRRVAGV